MRHDVENCSDECPHATGEKHVTQLRDCRVGQNFLNVVLRQADRSCEQSSCGADNSDDKHRKWRVRVDRRTTNDHVNARGHHCRRVNQRGHWRWSSHSIWQPHEQRNLCALSRGADKKKNCNRSDAAGEQCMPGKTIDWHVADGCESAGDPGLVEETD